MFVFPCSARASSRPNSLVTYLSLHSSEQKCTARRSTASSLFHTERIVTSRRPARTAAPRHPSARPRSSLLSFYKSHRQTESLEPPEYESSGSGASGQMSGQTSRLFSLEVGTEFLAVFIAIEIGFLALPRYLERLQLKSRKPPPREHDPPRKFPVLRY